MSTQFPVHEGGKWLEMYVVEGHGRDYDGQKMVCMDDFEDKEKGCLVYSFGINDDYSFENDMAHLGEQQAY